MFHIFTLAMTLNVFLPWKEALRQPRFRIVSLVTLVCLAATLDALRLVLDAIESRPGVILHDPLLALFNPIDLTWLTFGLIYGGLVVTLALLIPHPARLLSVAQSYILMILIRILCLIAAPLEPPMTTIPLSDPVVEFFGSAETILTKDLFFSGHTATLFLFALGLPDRRWRLVMFVVTACVAVAVLFQHVHYTIDVFVAPLVSYAAFRIVLSHESVLPGKK